MKYIILISVAIFLFACQNTQQPAENAEKTPAKSDLLHCYQYINKNDTVTLKTVLVGESLTGTLEYNFFEKDKNRGTIQGHMEGDLLIATYTFFSEGTQSARQVAFKKVNSDFIEGYGDITEENGITKFKNIDSLDFSHSILLKEYDCEK